jgi:hypothetical protein
MENHQSIRIIFGEFQKPKGVNSQWPIIKTGVVDRLARKRLLLHWRLVRLYGVWPYPESA